MQSEDQQISKKPSANPVLGLGLYLGGLSRIQKRIIFLLIDVVLFVVCLVLALYLRLGLWSSSMIAQNLPVFLFVGIMGPLCLWMFGFYKTLIRAFDFRSVNALIAGCVALSVSLTAFAYLYEPLRLPRSTPFIYFLLLFLFLGSSRVLARWLYIYSSGISMKRTPVLIFGTGEFANKIATILSGSTEFSLVGFLDDDPGLRGNYMRGRKVHGRQDIRRLVKNYGPVKILLGLENLTPNVKREIYKRYDHPDVTIEVVPPFTEVIAGRATLENMRELRIEDLLGRTAVPPVPELFAHALQGSTVMITGGGGSIGSELCRQVLMNEPAKLILLDHSEFALYRIEQELSEMQRSMGSQAQITYHLGKVEDRNRIARLLKEYQPDLFIHAAAYKHVPIVEDNVLEAVRNNILGTQVPVEECAKAGCPRFILVSTDKAVRPTNVMGATKRFAEMVVQACSEKSPGTVFSMVRFGNVLGSSGSVIPLFKKQIENGGPVTVTHKDITRYFMTIPEAAQLVIQAAFLAKGGEVFVLDMGDPVKIDDLAKIAVRLSGLTFSSKQFPAGDIEIIYTGLRPGEKLYEELLIDGNASGTLHPKIMTAMESKLSQAEMKAYLIKLREAVETGDESAAIKVLSETVSGIHLTNQMTPDKT